jgi:hypothetical protein
MHPACRDGVYKALIATAESAGGAPGRYLAKLWRERSP